MNVIGHEDVDMNRQAIALCRFVQDILKEQAVFVVRKNRIAIIAAQDDVLGGRS